MRKPAYSWLDPQAISVAGTDARGASRANEDAVMVTASSLIVIDGATGLAGNRMERWASDAQWFAQSLAGLLGARLEDERAIDVVLHECLEELRAAYGEEDAAGLGPSASVLIARLRGAEIQVFSLGDCLALVGVMDGEVDAVRDGAVGELDARVLVRLQEVRGDLPLAEALPLVTDLLVENRKLRNSPEGYWIADLSALGVDHAITRTYRASDVGNVALMTDGYAAALDVVGVVTTPGQLLDRLVREGPHHVMKALEAALSSDRVCLTFPRLKVQDDSSVILASPRADCAPEG